MILGTKVNITDIRTDTPVMPLAKTLKENTSSVGKLQILQADFEENETKIPPPPRYSPPKTTSQPQHKYMLTEDMEAGMLSCQFTNTFFCRYYCFLKKNNYATFSNQQVIANLLR